MKEVRYSAMYVSKQRSFHTEGAAEKKLLQQHHPWYFLITRKPVKLEGSKKELDRSEVMEMMDS